MKILYFGLSIALFVSNIRVQTKVSNQTTTISIRTGAAEQNMSSWDVPASGMPRDGIARGQSPASRAAGTLLSEKNCAWRTRQWSSLTTPLSLVHGGWASFGAAVVKASFNLAQAVLKEIIGKYSLNGNQCKPQVILKV